MNQKQAPPNNPKSQASTNKRPKVAFTQKEDQIINFFVNLIGTKNWPSIAKYVNGRTAKQCRDRYVNYLKPGLTNIEWTHNEDELLLELYNKNGPKWSLISKNFKNRNQISLKNRIIFLQKHRNQLNENEKIKKSGSNKNLYILPVVYHDDQTNELFDIFHNSLELNNDDDFIFNSEGMNESFSSFF